MTSHCIKSLFYIWRVLRRNHHFECWLFLNFEQGWKVKLVFFELWRHQARHKCMIYTENTTITCFLNFENFWLDFSPSRFFFVFMVFFRKNFWTRNKNYTRMKNYYWISTTVILAELWCWHVNCGHFFGLTQGRFPVAEKVE